MKDVRLRNRADRCGVQIDHTALAILAGIALGAGAVDDAFSFPDGIEMFSISFNI